MTNDCRGACERQQMKETLDRVYEERSHMIALISLLLPASLQPLLEDDVDHRWVVYVQMPGGDQLAWPIHDSHLYLFPHLKDRGWVWDGHSYLEKYERIRQICHKW